MARLGVLLILSQIILACATPAVPSTVAAPTSTLTTAPAAAPTPIPTTAIVQPTSTGAVASPSSTAIAPPTTTTTASYPAPQAPVTPLPPSPYPSPATVARPLPSPTSSPVAVATATHVPAAPATATTAAAVALTVPQIAATAIASAAGEQCVASPPKPAKGFIGDPVRGRMLFVDRGCSACHGDQAQGLVGPKLAGTTLTFGAVIQQLRQPRGTMQRYLPKDQSDADECDVYQYVRNLKS